MYIDGQWTDAQSGDVREITNPYNGAVIARVAEGDRGDCRAAIAAARDAFDNGPWPNTPAADRGALLLELSELVRRDREALAELETLDTGKTIEESRWDMDDIAGIFKYFGGLADKNGGEVIPSPIPDSTSIVVREPGASHDHAENRLEVTIVELERLVEEPFCTDDVVVHHSQVVNIPEGMAVGVGFAEGNVAKGVPLALGIFLQNIPEGLAIAVALFAIGYSRRFAFSLAVLTGLVEPLGGLFGATLVSVAIPLLPWILGGAAGAMLFIISNEIIPETHKDGHENAATFSLMGGFGLMVILDAALA